MAWYDDMTPEQAKAFMDSPVQVKVVGRDVFGRDIVTQVNPLHLRALYALRAKAEQAV